MSAFPFDPWLRLSVTVFKIPPADFWAMSVRDWLTLTAAEPRDISPGDLRALMMQFPDSEADNER